jgi:non-heme chloroperoxidase
MRSKLLFLPILLLILLLAHTARAAGPGVANDGFLKTSDGVRLHDLEAGSGPALLFEPGWSMPAWIWDLQIRHFAEHYHVIALDPRSQGGSDKPPSGNCRARRAQDINELIEQLNAGPVVLVRWSLRVPELVTYAEHYGGSRVRAYVLVDGFAWDKLDPQFTTAMLGMHQRLETDHREFTEKFVRSMYKKPQSEEYIVFLLEASLRMPTDSAIAASVASINRTDWRPAIAKLDLLVLIMCQTALKAMAADLVASTVPSTRVELFDDAGHGLFVDDAAHFNAVLDDFLQYPPK